jgi:hypothetical protein
MGADDRFATVGPRLRGLERAAVAARLHQLSEPAPRASHDLHGWYIENVQNMVAVGRIEAVRLFDDGLGQATSVARIIV